MDVAIVGASGDCGRQIATRLIESRMLPAEGRLQLVGRAGGRSAGVLEGFVHDLVDAYDETTPHLDVALHAEDITADVVVMAAGLTVPPDTDGLVSRADLAEVNAPLFRATAETIAAEGTGNELVVVVSNPVELGVKVFSEVLGRHRVIGMGANSDSMRFRREVAESLGIRRQRVTGWVVGEHGDDQVPLWSTVRVHGVSDDDAAPDLARIRGNRPLDALPDEIGSARGVILDRLRAGDAAAAFAHVESLTPDLRAILRPWAIHVSGAKTAVATAAATVELLDAILEGRDVVVGGQVELAGELHGMCGVTGVPVVLTPSGWTQVVDPGMTPDEVEAFARVTNRIRGKLDTWLGAA